MILFDAAVDGFFDDDAEFGEKALGWVGVVLVDGVGRRFF